VSHISRSLFDRNVIRPRKVNSPDADVTFQSCDGILFSIHRPNLQTNTEGFPPPEISTGDEIVPLSESSATLEILFQFIYPRRHPALDEIAFADLAALAEAAEKYQVFASLLFWLYIITTSP
jgi:hypothetical protein